MAPEKKIRSKKTKAAKQPDRPATEHQSITDSSKRDAVADSGSPRPPENSPISERKPAGRSPSRSTTRVSPDVPSDDFAARSRKRQTSPPVAPAVGEPQGRPDPAALREPLKERVASTGKQPRLSVAMIASEAHPFAKTGGLAEVAAALPAALARLGHSVTLVLPRYRGIDVAGLTTYESTLRFGSRIQPVTIHERSIAQGVTVALIDAPELFDREGLYGASAGDYPDNAWRFAVFSRAALEYIRRRAERPSVIHAHDWQTGLVPVYQKMHLSTDPIVGGVPVMFTIHNLAFQGIFPASTLAEIGLGWQVLDVQAMEYWGRISYLKAGINFSEKITTVSPTYAREILRPELGFGFDGVLTRRANDLVGILNGIDTDRWNPSADPFIPAPFSVDDLSGKQEAKRALLGAAGLSAEGSALARPLIGQVSRLTDQKGLDLIAAAAEDLMSLDAMWVTLGSGEARYERLWRNLAERHPNRVSATIGFDERLAHLIEAGADLFLMPSRFEPCGLNQMYSLRYGTVPIVRATGGLDDTVEDFDEQSGRGTGFKFREYAPGALVETVARALRVFPDRDTWRRIQQAGMRLDHSWDASAGEYVKVYRAMVESNVPVPA